MRRGEKSAGETDPGTGPIFLVLICLGSGQAVWLFK